MDHLVEKHSHTVTRLADAEAYLKSIEESINDKDLIVMWQKEQDEWEAKVIDVSNHKGMTNPFKVPTDACMSCLP